MDRVSGLVGHLTSHRMPHRGRKNPTSRYGWGFRSIRPRGRLFRRGVSMRSRPAAAWRVSSCATRSFTICACSSFLSILGTCRVRWYSPACRRRPRGGMETGLVPGDVPCLRCKAIPAVPFERQAGRSAPGNMDVDDRGLDADGAVILGTGRVDRGTGLGPERDATSRRGRDAKRAGAAGCGPVGNPAPVVLGDAPAGRGVVGVLADGAGRVGDLNAGRNRRGPGCPGHSLARPGDAESCARHGPRVDPRKTRPARLPGLAAAIACRGRSTAPRPAVGPR